MADSLENPDPHGTRGSTEHHALDYKKEVKSFNSADILAAFNAAKSGGPDRGVPTSAPSQPAPSAPAAPPAPTPAAAAVRSFNSADLIGNLDKATKGDYSQDSYPSSSGGATKVRSWIDEPIEEKPAFSFDGLKDALATTAAPAAPKATTPSGPPPNLLDITDNVPPPSAGSYAPTLSDDWAALEAKPPPGVSAFGSAAVAISAGAPPAFPPNMPPPTMPPPNMPPPNMPPPNMPPPNMPPPNMPPPNMPPPPGPPPAAKPLW